MLPVPFAHTLFGLLVCSVLSVLNTPARASISPPILPPIAPKITSPHWLVQHWQPNGSARTLSQQAADVPTHPASITKLLTAFVVLQAVAKSEVALNHELTVSALATQQDGTRVGYVAGERVRIQDALQGMLAISGNDAAWALGEHVEGTMPAFLARMNAASTALGLRSSRWLNPHGLTQTEHQSSAADLALLAHALWRDFPSARPWLGVKNYTWNGTTQSNRNSLLWRDATVDGLKTGHTDAAGYNLAATSQWSVDVAQDRFDWRLTSIVLGAASAAARASDSAALLAWGRANFTPWRLYQQGDALGAVKIAGSYGTHPVYAPAAVWVVLGKQQQAIELRYELHTLPQITLPIAAGAIAAQLHIYDGQTLLASSPALSRLTIDRAPWHLRLWQWVKSWFN